MKNAPAVLLLSGLLAASLAAPALAQPSPASPVAPNLAEFEFWKSADRIGTPDAYKAYLDTYPSGHYAGLARVAMSRPASGSPAGGTSPRGLSDAMVKRLYREAPPAQSGAVSFRTGDSLEGAGPITVGRFGSKMQLLVPNGTWFVLSALDHPQVAHMASVYIGQFQGNALRSIIVYQFNGRSFQRRLDSPMLDRCVSAAVTPNPGAQTWQIRTGQTHECVAVSASQPLPSAQDPGWSMAVAGLQSIGASPPNNLVWRTEVHLADQLGNLLSVERYDLALEGTTPEARLAWARAYAKIAIPAFQRDLQGEEIEPNREMRASVELPD